MRVKAKNYTLGYTPTTRPQIKRQRHGNAHLALVIVIRGDCVPIVYNKYVTEN